MLKEKKKKSSSQDHMSELFGHRNPSSLLLSQLKWKDRMSNSLNKNHEALYMKAHCFTKANILPGNFTLTIKGNKINSH